MAVAFVPAEFIYRFVTFFFVLGSTKTSRAGASAGNEGQIE